MNIPRVDILTVIGKDTPLRRKAGTSGGEWSGPCPFCGGRDRFSVQPLAGRGGRWLCRGCGGQDGHTWHDAVDYVRRRDGLSFSQAVSVLRGIAGQPAPGRSSSSPAPVVAAPTQVAQTPPDLDWQARALSIVRAGTAALLADTPAGQAARDYLAARGLTPDTWRRYWLGLSDGGPLGWGIVIPTVEAGNVWAVKARRLAWTGAQLTNYTGDGKYHHLAGGTARVLFGAENLVGRDVALLVEGELDAALLWPHAEALGVGIATLTGASGRVGFPWAWYIAGVRAVVLAYDTDDAGVRGAAALAASLPGKARVVSVPALRPGDKDPTDFWRSGGDVQAWLLAVCRDNLVAECQPNTQPAHAIRPSWPGAPGYESATALESLL